MLMTTTRRPAQGQGQGVRVRARATQPNPSTCITEQNRHRVEGRVGQAGRHPHNTTNKCKPKHQYKHHHHKESKETPRARDQEQSVNIQRTSSARTTLEPNSHDASELDDDIVAEMRDVDTGHRAQCTTLRGPGDPESRRKEEQFCGGSPRVLVFV